MAEPVQTQDVIIDELDRQIRIRFIGGQTPKVQQRKSKTDSFVDVESGWTAVTGYEHPYQCASGRCQCGIDSYENHPATQALTHHTHRHLQAVK